MSSDATAPAAAASVPILAGPKPRSLWSDAWRRLRRNWAAVAGMVAIVALVLVAVFAGLLAPYPYAEQHIEATFRPIGTPGYPLGTDQLGRDLLSRLIYGARISLGVAFTAQLIVLLIGLPVGILAGASSRTVDNLLMRFTDIMYAFPELLFVIIILAVLGRNLIFVPLAIGIVSWTTMARLVRGQILSLKEQDYVLAARALGVPQRRIVLRHMLPNTLTPVIVAVTLGIPQYILLEATLSFIGIGAPPPVPSWGLMILDGFNSIFSFPHLVVLPGIAIAITMLSFTFLGDGLRDALDPRAK